MSGIRVPVYVAVVIGVALPLAWLENWMLWGYAVWRPSLVKVLDDADELLAFSMIRFQPRPAAIPASERTMSMDIRKSYCRPRTNECRDGLLLLRLEERFGDMAVVSQVDLQLVEAAWASLLATGWVPAVPGSPYTSTGVPLSGFAIATRQASQDYLLLTFGTGQLANDRYAYSELLYRVDDGRPHLVKQIHYFLEIAGIEGLEWPVLWPLNAAVLLVGCHVLRRRRPQTSRQGSAQGSSQ